MNNFSIPVKHLWIIVISGLLLNVLFFSATYKRYFFAGIITEHGEIGFNLYHNNNIQVCQKRIETINELQNKQQQLIDPIEVSMQSESSMRYRSINDTIGYGVLLGLLWKITNSLRYQDVQVLQILLFILALLLLYKISLLLFGNYQVALWSCVAQLLFFPLIFLNVHPLRDIWSYYGIILLLYGLLRARKEHSFDCITFLCAVGFVFCQWLRPPVFFTLFAVGFSFFLWRKEAIRAWFIFLVINLFLFWIPFVVYNKVAYNRYFVSTAGQDLYEGLGEFPNSWEIKMDDAWCGDLIYQHYGLSYGTPEFQDKAAELFWRCVQEKPWEYVGQLFRRLPLLIFFAANWSFDEMEFNQLRQVPIIGCFWWFFLKIIGYTLAKFQYMRLYLLFGWLSALLLWKRRRYFEVVLIVSIAWTCASKFPSHLEPRYLVPSFALFSLFVGHGMHSLLQRISAKYNISLVYATD